MKRVSGADIFGHIADIFGQRVGGEARRIHREETEDAEEERGRILGLRVPEHGITGVNAKDTKDTEVQEGTRACRQPPKLRR